MPLDIIDTLGNEIKILDDGTTIADIMYALQWVQKEKARQRGKHQKYYVPKGGQRGRPKKNPDEESPVEQIKNLIASAS